MRGEDQTRSRVISKSFAAPFAHPFYTAHPGGRSTASYFSSLL